MLIRHVRRGRSRIEGPKMIVVKDRIFYTPSPAARAIISLWCGSRVFLSAAVGYYHVHVFGAQWRG